MNKETPPAAMTRRALLIINPVSGKKMILRYIPQVIRIFMDAGYLVTTMVTARRGEATAFARGLGRDYDLICCTGGDGTLNETITGLVAGDLQVPLAYIPCGSTNDFALSRGLSTDIPTAAEQAARGKPTRYDIGRFGDQVFSYVAAFGAFSWLSYTTDQNLKNVLGHTAYILDGIKDLSKIKPLHVKLTVDGSVYEDDYLFGAVCNSTSIAGTLVNTFAPLLLNSIMMVFYLVLMLRQSPLLSLIGIVTLALNAVMARVISTKRMNVTRVQMRDAGKLESSTVTGIS
ncbi:MAG: YegS/Rv2252/BmrU family lipid kinase, partial [Oscillospiraceae bacterium]|nr:YegS/Rv2252/BmrU family lipid kinase [Oscillospiraceae bacterium]